MSRHPKPPKRETTAPAEKLPPAALEALALEKDYGDAPALHPLTLRVEFGERVALLGHNGSGKSTLLRVLAGLWPHGQGQVVVTPCGC